MNAQNTTSPSAFDKKFVQSALEGGQAEVELGQLAALKGSADDVKEFGRKMVEDHTKLGEQIKDVAQKEGISEPSGISSKGKSLEEKLRSLSGDAFDNAYIKAMLKDHQQDLSEFKKEADSGNDTSIKGAADQAEQIIREHLSLAEEMAQKHNLLAVGQQPNGHRGQQR